MKTLLLLLIGAGLGIWAYMHFKESAPREGRRISESAGQVTGAIERGIADLDTSQIREELERSGQVVRKKAEQAGAAIADATADSRITASIKGKLALDSKLSATSISVNTTRGVVTLSGAVSSHDDIKRAMRLALDTEGVTEVVSTLQVRR